MADRGVALAATAAGTISAADASSASRATAVASGIVVPATDGRSAPQVMLRWHLQQGREVIPKSINPARITENFAVFDFDLAEDELTTIDGLDLRIRRGPEPDTRRVNEGSFTIPDD